MRRVRGLRGQGGKAGSVAIDVVTGLYALALAASGVMLTFVAIADGLSLAVIAALGATSAAAQFVSRVAVGALYRVATDRVIMAGALGMLAASMVLVLAAPGVTGLVLAQVLQGVSRACFWSGSQVHVIRIAARPAPRMARNQFIANGLGALGPMLAGALADGGPRSAAVPIAVVAVLGAGLCALLAPLPLFECVPKSADNRIWRYRDVRVGSLGSLAAGGFNAILVTFVPVLFDDVGWSEADVGLLVGAANGGLVVGALLGGWLPRRCHTPALTAMTAAIGLGVVALAAADAAPVVSVAGVVGAGIASGVILTLGPTVVGAAVPDPQRGSAVVFAGVFRAGALLAMPLLVTAVTLVAPMAIAMVAGGIAAGAPGVLAALIRPRRGR